MNIAILGVGNIGEWLIEKIKGFDINKIFVIGRSLEKTQAQVDDFLHAQIIHKTISPNQLPKPKIIATTSYEVISECEIVIFAFGHPMDETIRERSDLLIKNGMIAKSLAEQVKVFLQETAFIINIANPLDIITSVLCQYTKHNPERVFGVSGLLDNARLAHAIMKEFNISLDRIDLKSLHVYGEHGLNMVPILSQVKIDDKPLLLLLADRDAKKRIVDFTTTRGTQMMRLRSMKPPYIATAEAAARMIFALQNEKPVPIDCCAYDHERGIFIGLNVLFSKKPYNVGFSEINDEEKLAIENAVVKIQESLKALKNAI